VYMAYCHHLSYFVVRNLSFEICVTMEDVFIPVFSPII